MELFFYLKCEESKITEIFLLDFKKLVVISLDK